MKITHIVLSLIGALVFGFSFVSPSYGQRLVSKLSVQEISINSTFTGGNLSLFGNVEAQLGDNVKTRGPFDLIVMVEGPAVNKVVREKSRQMGIWLNAQQVQYSGVPAYFHILSTQALTDITSEEKLAELGISLQSQIQNIDSDSPENESRFTDQLIRLMGRDDIYGQSPHVISFHSDTFYSAKLDLPSNVPNGTYLATTFLFKNGELLDRNAERFFVRTVGMEKFISDSARDFPAFYGIVTVLLALFTGWFGGVVFRR
ncbi:MAG: TIGR02186 family protein [Devosiaceae bacterium]|nr:TIGR02186 family protein [Devosiaceae bacterium]